eukprot:8740220-Karenia_brevis.AAC.1
MEKKEVRSDGGDAVDMDDLFSESMVSSGTRGASLGIMDDGKTGYGEDGKNEELKLFTNPTFME